MKRMLFTLVVLLATQIATKAQVLQIVNSRKCTIIVNVNVNGPCFSTGTCDMPTGGVVTVTVPGSTTLTFPSIGMLGYTCAPLTYEYVRAGIQNLDCDQCSGAGVTVGEPCVVFTGFGPTCYSGIDCSGFCAEFTRPTGMPVGSARITVW